MAGEHEHINDRRRARSMTEMRVRELDANSRDVDVKVPEHPSHAGLVDASTFCAVVGHSPSGVSVVTTRDANGCSHGITVSSYASLSLDPPLMLICIDTRSRIHPVLSVARSFAVNILSAEQESLARQFSSRADDRFERVPCSPGESGDLLIADALAFLECRLVNAIRAGDHTIFIGAVSAAGAKDGNPLLRYRGAYTEPLTRDG
jgi:flavin reductase (DIM6/NTAB) family NADH-FMN oxidoreductase RutF